MKEKISIIVPVYNVSKYLERCINSIIAQTYDNLEIILVDDGSTDSSAEICNIWAAKDNRIQVIHKPNGGLSDARNMGIQIASGNYIGFIDSDDYVADEMYENLIKAMIANNCEVAACAVQMVWEDDSKQELMTPKTCCVLTMIEAEQALLNEDLLKQPVWYKLYDASIAKQLLFEKGKLHEDVFWSYQAISLAERVCIIDYIGYYYVQRKESIMGARYSIKRLNEIEAYCQRLIFFRDRIPTLVPSAAIHLWGSLIYHGQMAIKYLPQEECKRVFKRLEEVQSEYPLELNYCLPIKWTHKIWFFLSRTSLKATCKIRNVVGVGKV